MKRGVLVLLAVAVVFVGVLVIMDYYALMDVLTQRGVMGFL